MVCIFYMFTCTIPYISPVCFYIPATCVPYRYISSIFLIFLALVLNSSILYSSYTCIYTFPGSIHSFILMIYNPHSQTFMYLLYAFINPNIILIPVIFFNHYIFLIPIYFCAYYLPES